MSRRPKRIGSNAGRGFTLAEVLVALSLVASAGVAATGTGLALTALAARARAEVVALELAGAKIEELSAKPSEERGNGFDEIEEDAVRVTRMWRVWTGDPEPGLKRLEVTARWRDPQLNIVTLVAVSP